MDNSVGAMLIMAILGSVAFLVGLYVTRKEPRDRHAARPADRTRGH